MEYSTVLFNKIRNCKCLLLNTLKLGLNAVIFIIIIVIITVQIYIVQPDDS